MVHDKTWLENRNRSSSEYLDGLQKFVDMAKDFVDSSGKVRCPCVRCQNSILGTHKRLKAHLDAWGFDRHYTRWIYHGEDFMEGVTDHHQVEVPPVNDMADVIDDLRQGVTHEEEGNSGSHHEEGNPGLNHDEENSGEESSGVGDDFDDLLKEVQSELYPGSKFNSLDFLANLMHIKVKNKWTNTSVDELFKLLRDSYPEGNRIPDSYNQAKKILKKVGLGYESIHVCKNDCALFWKEHESLQNCPICNESRWVDKNTKGKKVAHKVLRYFPLEPRLRRLYYSRHTAKDMIWHSIGRSEDGTMRHPVDGTSWKEFDSKYPAFSSEPRNVRLGLAADGFNPFGNMSSAHSTWPVILTTYNLPPWLCMKESSFMLTLLIPGPKSPGKDMDVFLRPLFDELKFLWNTGVKTKDAAKDTIFTMKAALLWTINDFPARSHLSGWSGQGYKACPTCNKDTPSVAATSKFVYVGHRQWLHHKHMMRSNLDFNGREERRRTPKKLSEADIERQPRGLIYRLPGKHPSFGGVTRKREEFELNWTKRSIFFELEYWSSLELKHNLDLMHIERNVCDSLLGTLLMNDKSKDTIKARQDLEVLGIRKHLWLKKDVGAKKCKPHPNYSFKVDDRKLFCEFIKMVKLPDGFGSNISKRVTDNNTNISGLKAHDCHILMQRLIPNGVKAFLLKEVSKPIIELCMFFKQLCSRKLLVDDMRKSKAAIIMILCQLELIFPPAFFDIMVHLVMHLPDEAISGGPVCMRWMYPFERYMKKLKNYVRNKARPEGCIAEGYVAEEALSFCSKYLRDAKTNTERNEVIVVEKTKLWVFQSKCRPASANKIKQLSVSEKINLEWFVLDSCEESRNFINEFKSEHPHADVKLEFSQWFLQKAFLMREHLHPELCALSMGVDMHVSTYTACIVNGVRFMVLDRDARRTTQNSGISVDGENGEKWYGQLEEIIELHYPDKYSTVLFRCKWFDTTRGVRCENNITSINTQHEWNKDDQLIFASQAKQVFYIQEPSRGQKNNHRWVVEHVNYRRIWDLPLNIQNVDGNDRNDSANARNGDSPEDLDVVNNNSSSTINLSIDFSQYDLPNIEPSIGVEAAEGEIADMSEDESDEANEGENDDEEDEPVYDTEGLECDTEISDGEMSD